MTRKTQRASQATVDSVHRLVGKELARQLKAAGTSDAPVSAALLTASIAYLKLTGTADPAQPKRKTDTLRGVMPDFDELERGMQVPPKGA